MQRLRVSGGGGSGRQLLFDIVQSSSPRLTRGASVLRDAVTWSQLPAPEDALALAGLATIFVGNGYALPLCGLLLLHFLLKARPGSALHCI